MALAGHGDGSAEVEPTLVAGNPACPDGLVEAKIEAPAAGGTVSAVIDGRDVTATITDLDPAGRFSFAIDGGLAGAVVAKGGPDGHVYDYQSLPPGGIAHDDGLTPPVRDPGPPPTFYGISHISFCLSPLPPLSLSVDKTAAPTSLPEPGGAVDFAVSVTNTSQVDLDLTSLVDDVHGDLNGNGDCLVPSVVPAGGTYSCSFEATVSGNAGFSETDTVTATGVDSTGRSVSASDDAVVTVTDVAPVISLTKDASPSSVPEPGGDVTYTVTVTNSSVEDVTITSLSDDVLGTLAGDEDCAVGTALAPGASCEFDFSGSVAGNAGDTHTNVATATAADDESNSVSASDDAVVTVTGRGQIAPTATTCADFASMTAGDLNFVEYGVRGGLINNTAPGVFFYYTNILAPATSFTIEITESVVHPSFTTPFAVQQNQVRLYDADCNDSSLGSATIGADGSVTISVDGATPGQELIASVKYETSSVVGQAVPDPTTVHYDFATSVGGVVAAQDPDGVDLTAK